MFLNFDEFPFKLIFFVVKKVLRIYVHNYCVPKQKKHLHSHTKEHWDCFEIVSFSQQYPEAVAEPNSIGLLSFEKINHGLLRTLNSVPIKLFEMIY